MRPGAPLKIQKPVAGLILAVVIAAAAIGGYYLGIRGGGGGANFQDNFDTLNQNIWFANFYQLQSEIWSSSYGTAYTDNGLLYMRPSYSRGAMSIQTRKQVVTTLPATVKFRIRFEENYYRYTIIFLNSVFEEVVGNNPRIQWYLHTTNQIFYPYGQFLRAYKPDNSYVESNRVFKVVPVNEWLEGEIRLYNDRVETSFNGVNLVLHTNVESIVDFAGGLNLYFETGDDYGQKGIDIDWVTVESGAS